MTLPLFCWSVLVLRISHQCKFLGTSLNKHKEALSVSIAALLLINLLPTDKITCKPESEYKTGRNYFRIDLTCRNCILNFVENVPNECNESSCHLVVEQISYCLSGLCAILWALLMHHLGYYLAPTCWNKTEITNSKSFSVLQFLVWWTLHHGRS